MQNVAEQQTRRDRGWGRWLWVLSWARVAMGLGLCLGLTFACPARTFLDSEYLIDSWETADGLPENSATAMVQTPDGYLWFGSFNGLVRFDGVRFTVLDPSNTPGLPSAGIVNLHLDSGGRLWVSTDRGLVVSEPGRWTGFQPVPGWSSTFVRSFSESAGVLCLTGFDGKVFLAREGRLETLPDPPGRPGAGAVGCVDRRGRIWVAEEAGGYFGYWSGREWQASPLAARVLDGFAGITLLATGEILCLNRREMLRLEDGEVRSQTRLSRETRIEGAWGAREGRGGEIWVAAEGLYRLLPNGQVRRFTTANGLTYNNLRFTFEDREGNLWVGSSGGGLMRFKRRTFLSHGETGGDMERNVKAVVETTPGRILLGTYGGGVYEWNGGVLAALPGDQQPGSSWVQCLLRDRQGGLWMGGYAGGSLEKPALSMLTSAGLTVAPREVGGQSIEALFEDSQGRIWIGGSQGVTRHEGGRFVPEDGPRGVSMDAIHAFAEDRQHGLVWAANSEGLFRLRSGSWEEVLREAGTSVKDILCLRVEVDGTLWMGGAGGGILRYREGRWSSVTEAHGLPTRHITCMVDDGSGHGWLGSNRGVIRLRWRDLARVADGTLARLECQKFDLSDGLPSVECAMGMQTTAVRAADGRIWFATLKGVAVVDPAGLLLNTNPPPVRIEEILVEDARGGRHVVPVSGEGVIELRPDTREVAVYLAGLSFTAPEKMRFAYRLEGVDAEWRDLGNQRTLYFNKPAPGHYRLLARASNNDGLWNEVGAVVAFQVQPFVVETLWFRGLVVLVLGGGLGLGFTAYQRSRTRRAEEHWTQRQALAAERARSAALVQHAADAIVLLNGEGRVLYESPSASRAFGRALEPGGVRDPLEHVHPADRERVHRAFQAVIAGTHRGGPVEFRVAHPEGGWRHFEAVGTNLLSQPGVEGVLITAREVTERRRAEAETRALQAALIEAQRMEAIGQLAGGVAHDFNNILTAILMDVALLQEESDLPVEVRKGLGELEAEARRAANLTRQLLMFSRREVLQTRTFEVHALLYNLLKMLRRVIGERITLDFNGAAGDLWITADPGMIERVVVNLVVNARDAMPSGGRITLAFGETTLDAAPTLHHPEAARGRFVRLSVTDTGVGMDETTRQRIFEPFFTTKAAGKGTGLGLATVYGIVRQHRGWLEVDSAPGRGTTFHMFLPAAEPAPVETEATPEPQALPRGDETILLVEDSERVRRVTASTLRRLGYRVLEAEHGPDAVRIWSAEREGIDLLLTDMVMPGDLTGRDLGRQFHREKPTLKCLLMSGYSPDLVDGGPLLEHESGFIPKPFEPATLARRVRECLDRR